MTESPVIQTFRVRLTVPIEMKNPEYNKWDARFYAHRVFDLQSQSGIIIDTVTVREGEQPSTVLVIFDLILFNEVFHSLESFKSFVTESISKWSSEEFKVLNQIGIELI